MSIIKQNPFRVLGLTGDASERELQRQIGIIKRYCEINKTPYFDYDFEFIGELYRDTENVQIASNEIEQAYNKLHYSLFWFVNKSRFDEIAFNNLKNKEIEKASEIWNKTLKEEVADGNYSSYLNLSTLYIAIATEGSEIDIAKLALGISLKGKLIYSDSFGSFFKLVTGNESSINATKIAERFAQEIVALVHSSPSKDKIISPHEIIALFDTFPKSFQKYILNKFTEEPISNIENKIEKATIERRANPRDAEKYGTNLYKLTKSDIVLLEKILGDTSLAYQSIANKLADELLQCSIYFFNNHCDGKKDFDPGEDAQRVAEYAQSLGATGQTQERIKESLDFIKKWIDDAPARKREQVVASDVEFINRNLEHFQSLANSLSNSRDLRDSCMPKLINIKNELGASDKFYIAISSAVVRNVLNMIIEVANRQQSQMASGMCTLNSLASTISSAVKLLNEISLFAMTIETRAWYSKNKNTIESINSTLQSAAPRSSSSSSSSSDGCYIATMVYGDFNHPQVLLLRGYRDEKLVKTLYGKAFVSFYYATSPYMVKILQNSTHINRMIRNILDSLIRKISK